MELPYQPNVLLDGIDAMDIVALAPEIIHIASACPAASILAAAARRQLLEPFQQIEVAYEGRVR